LLCRRPETRGRTGAWYEGKGIANKNGINSDSKYERDESTDSTAGSKYQEENRPTSGEIESNKIYKKGQIRVEQTSPEQDDIQRY
jgi:hypothetical protein